MSFTPLDRPATFPSSLPPRTPFFRLLPRRPNCCLTRRIGRICCPVRRCSTRVFEVSRRGGRNKNRARGKGAFQLPPCLDTLLLSFSRELTFPPTSLPPLTGSCFPSSRYRRAGISPFGFPVKFSSKHATSSALPLPSPASRGSALISSSFPLFLIRLFLPPPQRPPSTPSSTITGLPHWILTLLSSPLSLVQHQFSLHVSS